MDKSALATLGTTCLLIGLFLKYTLASNLRMKKDLKKVQDDVDKLKQQKAVRSIDGKKSENIS